MAANIDQFEEDQMGEFWEFAAHSANVNEQSEESDEEFDDAFEIKTSIVPKAKEKPVQVSAPPAPPQPAPKRKVDLKTRGLKAQAKLQQLEMKAELQDVPDILCEEPSPKPAADAFVEKPLAQPPVSFPSVVKTEEVAVSKPQAEPKVDNTLPIAEAEFPEIQIIHEESVFEVPPAPAAAPARAPARASASAKRVRERSPSFLAKCFRCFGASDDSKRERAYIDRA